MKLSTESTTINYNWFLFLQKNALTNALNANSTPRTVFSAMDFPESTHPHASVQAEQWASWIRLTAKVIQTKQ